MSSISNIVRDKSAPGPSGSVPEVAPARSFTQDLRYHPAYRPDIDGLRALAIIPVVIFHAFPAILPGGFVGVDVFFVISGYLISGIILKGLQKNSFTFHGFYANRIKRIFPALLLVLSVSFVFGWFFLLPGEFAQLGKHILGGAGYIENLILRREAGYFDTRSALKPLMHLWSLGIEEQFYLTYPFLLWALWRLRRNLLTIILSLVLISFLLNVWTVRGNTVSSFFLPQTRFWELWMGGALACLKTLPREEGSRFTAIWAWIANRKAGTRLAGLSTKYIYDLSSIAGLALIILSLLTVHEHAFPGWWALLPVCGTSLLILGGPGAWINRRILSNRVAVFVGLISYPLYLWHWPILSFARMLRGEEISTATRVGAIVAGFLLAWATWRFVESPIRFGRKLWIKTAILALVSVIVACAGYTTYRRDGFAERFQNLSGDFGWSQPETFTTPECRKMVGSAQMSYCRSFSSGAPDVLLIGDSHAGALYRGLAPAYAQRSQNLMNLGEPGCVPFYDTESYALGMRQQKDCRPIVNRMLDFATSSPSVRTIIVSVRGPKNMVGGDFGADVTEAFSVVSWSGAPENSSQAEVFAAAFRNTVSRLYATGKDVILFVDWPELGFDPRSCLPRPVPLFSHVRSLCGVPRWQVDDRNRAYREVIFDMKKDFTGLRIFDPFPYLCDSKACYAMHEGHLLYRDDNHLSAAGAAYLSAEFLAERRADGH